MSASFFFVDSQTNEPLESPKVWIDGAAVTLANSGTAVYSGSKKNVWGWVQAEGYTNQSFSVVGPDGTSSARTTVRVDPKPAVVKDVVFTTYPKPILAQLDVSGPSPENQGMIHVWTVNTSMLNGNDDPEKPLGSTAILAGLGPGAYHVKAIAAPAYQDCECDFTLPGGEQVDLNFVAAIGSGEEGQPEDPSVMFSTTVSGDDFDAAVAAAAPPKMDRDSFEAIYGNSAWEGYYTSAQARVYIGNMFIDEMQVIQYQVQANTVPIYGYASRFADAYAEGKSLVQGQLVLNYVSPAYMFTVLDTYRNTLADSDITAAVKNGQDLAKLLEARRVMRRLPGSPMPSIDTQIQAYASTPEAIQEAKKALRGDGFDPVYMNAVYLRTVFDMTIEIGDKEAGSYRRLEACRIISNEQILDQSGQVIGDAFGFIARRLR